MVQRVDVSAAPYERRIEIQDRSEDEQDSDHNGCDGYSHMTTPSRVPRPRMLQRQASGLQQRPQMLQRQASGLQQRHPAPLTRQRVVMFGGVSTMNLPSRVDEEDEYEAMRESDVMEPPRRSSLSTMNGGDRRSIDSSISTLFLSDSQKILAHIDPNRDLKRLTNRFRDERMEESFQLYTSMNDFPAARRILLSLLGCQVVAYLLFVILRHTCLGRKPHQSDEAQSLGYALYDLNQTSDSNVTAFHKLETCHRYQMPEVNPYFGILLWGFAPFTLLYGLFPLKYLESTMSLRIAVYYIRRFWKTIAALIVLLWAVGLDLFLHHVLFAVRDQRMEMIGDGELSCAKKNPTPREWSEQSEWWAHHKNREFLSVSFWILIYQVRLASSIIMAVLAVVATVTGIVSVALKLDFRHVLINSVALWGTTMGILFWGQSMSLSSRDAYNLGNKFFLFLCVLFPTCLTLVATYSEDRAARLAYASKVRAERINTTLKLDYSVKRMGLENRNLPKDEKELMEEALINANDTRILRKVAIPFIELELKDVVAKSPYGDILLADYHGTQVVIKRLALSSCTPDGLKDFKASVEMLAYLRHPNIVLFIGATYDNLANVGIVLEYLERGDVSTLLRSSIALTWSDPLLKIATDVALGVSYLHNCDPPLVHRDLKSSNLLCTATYSCKISDFGESKRQLAAGALFSTVVGTPYWLAPEILREEKYDVQVDCYSFGIVLIELETRKDPYFDQTENQSTIDIMMGVARGELRPTIPSTCLPSRRELIMRCLDPDPKRRPKMTEILSKLQHEVRQELMDQSSFEHNRDRRRVMLMQRHQRLNRRGLKDLLDQSLSDDEEEKKEDE
ncbi:hypothetical protein Poli38472_010506 [Pythium oligandrum]|uniref:Protein kinase domain-containing protein n=1 Tax=Pythium oligandrum TaxID=41045 RepID=A0A8K1C3A3_PYTOL|nr:hypothetical protein Poli38472_010506 [Pythium oligandrum]|eukprot:TMW55624.1 hypothetical protein Poli38472_010506 [Pythium oligandrum]